MPHITLNEKEIALLKSAVRRGDGNPSFQSLLDDFDHQLKELTGQMYISENNLELIRQYGCGSNKLSWQATLHAIFGRTLGDHFENPVDSCGQIVEIEKTDHDHPPTDGPSGRNRRVV